MGRARVSYSDDTLCRTNNVVGAQMEGKHFGSWVHEVEASNPIGNGYTLGARLKSQLNLNVELESVGTARILVGECSGPDSCQHPL